MSRTIAAQVPSVRTLEGAGMVVHRSFPTPSIPMLDPFLLLDEMGPADLTPAEAVGFPDHPHRGFETVTLVLEGSFEHQDSVGNHGFLGEGDVQWMTAGRGLVHSEMPSEAIRRDGGRLHGLQLWVNLPSDKKMTAPRYQDVVSTDIPVVRQGDTELRVVAGEVDGVRGVADTFVPITYVHAVIPAGSRATIPAPARHNAAVYVIHGTAAIGPRGQAVPTGHLAVLAADGDTIVLEAATGPTEALVLAGEPLDEPVARYGPFVMNTREEIIQAVDDFQAGRMGAIS